VSRLNDPHRIRREVYATLLVRPGLLNRQSVRWLIDAYGSIDLDGFLVWVVGFTGTLAQVDPLLALVEGLREATGRPVVVAGAGHLWQMLLSRGAAGAVAGRRTALSWPADALAPNPAPPVDPGTDEDGGWGIPVYHGEILGAIRIGEPGDVDRRRLFFRHPCPCGHHELGSPPEGQKAIRAHNRGGRCGRRAGPVTRASSGRRAGSLSGSTAPRSAGTGLD
jgi:hypothetical protein